MFVFVVSFLSTKQRKKNRVIYLKYRQRDKREQNEINMNIFWKHLRIHLLSIYFILKQK